VEQSQFSVQFKTGHIRVLSVERYPCRTPYRQELLPTMQGGLLNFVWAKLPTTHVSELIAKHAKKIISGAPRYGTPAFPYDYNYKAML